MELSAHDHNVTFVISLNFNYGKGGDGSVDNPFYDWHYLDDFKLRHAASIIRFSTYHSPINHIVDNVGLEPTTL